MEITFTGLGEDKQVKLRPSHHPPGRIVWELDYATGTTYTVALEVDEAHLIANALLTMSDIVQAEKESSQQ